MKQLRCSDAGFDCDAVVQAETVDGVMAQVGPHARDAHGVTLTPELEQQLAGTVTEA